MSTEMDVVVIGAGPAGMAAAAAAARAGASVAVLDEQPAPGGQIYRAVEAVQRNRPADMSFMGSAYAHGTKVTEAFRAVRTDYRPGATVWHIGAFGKGKRRDVVLSRARCRRDDFRQPRGHRHRRAGTTGSDPRLDPARRDECRRGAVGPQDLGRFIPRANWCSPGPGPLMLQLAAQLIAAHVPIEAIVDTTPARRSRPRVLSSALRLHQWRDAC